MAKLSGISETIKAEMGNKYEMANNRLDINENIMEESRQMQTHVMQLED